jgi:hypothetical protein
LRSRSVLTVLGPVELHRPYFLCDDCSQGQFPVDGRTGGCRSGIPPCVRRMEAAVGSEAPFVPGREPMKPIAGLEVTAKTIERAVEAVGMRIARRDEQEIGRAQQLILPVVPKRNIPIIPKTAVGCQSFAQDCGARTRACSVHTRVNALPASPVWWPPRSSQSPGAKTVGRLTARQLPFLG